MSKSAILAIKNINLFTNDNPEIQFSLSREEKVTAQYSAYDKEKGYDLRGVRAKSAAGQGYIRLVLSLVGAQGEKRAYFQGALFKNEKKETEKAPDFRGSITVSEGVKLALSAWIKTGEKAGQYLSVAISEFQSDSSAQPPARAPAAQNQRASRPADPFDMDGDGSRAPAPAAARQAPARYASAPARTTPPRQAPAPSRQPAPAGFDDVWDDVGF